MTQETFIKAKCYRCEGKIEFHESHKDEAITCPHCLQPIRLDETIRIVSPSSNTPLPDNKGLGLAWAIILFFVLSFGLIVGGVYYQQWKHEQHEKELRAIAYRYHVTVDTVKQVYESEHHDIDETERRLERWNKLNEAIINELGKQNK